MESITLQTNNTIVVQGSRLGQVQFAASAESDTGAARLVSARIYAQGEGSFTSISNPASLVFATAGPDSQAAVDRIKVNEEGDFVPVENSRYSLGLTSTRFGEVYSSSGIFNSLVIDGDSPKIFFKASGNLTPDITLNVLTTATSVASGVQTLSVQGSAGELFSITDILNTGTIFSVNDISGLELIGADADGTVRLAKFGTNVAVGNITPTQKLHVAGNFRLEGQFYDSLNSPGTSGEVLVSTSGGTDWRALSEIAGVDGTGSANYVARWSDADTIGTGVMFDDGFGVGIGTTTPGARLQVNTGGPMYAGIFVRGDASQSSPLQTWENSLGASLAQVDAGGRFSLRAAATGVAATHIPVFTADPASTTSQLVTRTAAQLRGDIGAQATLTNPVTGTGTNGQVSFWTGASTQSGNNDLFWDNANGRLGVGTASPSARLNVRGTSNYGMIRLTPTVASGESSIGFFDDTAGTDTNDAWIIGQGGWSNAGDFLIGNENNGAGGNVRLLIEKSGNVGIGTTSPAQKLHVAGDINVSTGQGFRINNAATAGQYLRGDATRFVSSAIQAGDVPTLNQNTTGSAGTLLREDNRVVAPNELSSTFLKFGFGSYNNNNTSPYADFLHMRSYQDSSGGSDNFLVFNKSGIGARLYQQAWNSATAYASYKDIVLADNSPTINYIPKYTTTGNTVSIANSQIFDNGTNVGIGTTSPTAKLHVVGTGHFSNSVTTSGTLVFASGNTGEVGRMRWDDGEGTVALMLKGGNIDLEIGQEQLALCSNNTGSTINKGKVVYINGVQGQRPAIALAGNATEETSSKTFGLVAENIANGAEGFVATYGVVKNINTSAFTAGSGLWLSTNGDMTMTRPQAPLHGVHIGYCLNSHASAGRVFVRVQNGFEIDELHDVLIQSPTSGNILQYDSSINVWRNRSISVAGIGTVSSIATNNGVTGGTITTTGTIGLTGNALSLHNLATNGIVARTAANTVTARTITGTANQVTVTNGDGVAGNPTLSLPQNIHTTATPTFGATTINGTVGIRASSTASTTTQIPVFTADPSATTRVLTTRTPAQLRADIGAQATLTNPVTGTGANGQVSFWTGASTQGGNNNLFWDNANGRLGLGTDSPSARLDVSGSILGTDVSTRNFFQVKNGVPRTNLGSPSVTEIAAFQEQYDNKLAFYPPANITYETYDGTTWTEVTLTDEVKKNLVGGDFGTTITVPHGTNAFRFTIRNRNSYVFVDALYAYLSTQGNLTQIHIWAKHDSGNWVQHTNSSVLVGGWPSHAYLPFPSLAWLIGGSLGTHVNDVRIEFTPSWTHASNSIQIYRMQLWGGYPAAKRTVYTVDADRNISLPNNLSIKASTTSVAATQIPVFTADPASTTRLLVTRTPAQLRADIGAQATLTNPVTGTGANGQVSFWTGTTTQGGDNGLFWSNTNKRLGLGLTDPSSDLHIRRTTGTFIRLGVSSANANGVGGDISWFTNESVTSDFLGALRLQFSGGTADVNRQMQFLVGDLSTPKFIVNGTGNVGIGTTSPAAKLHVVGDVISDYLRADTFNDGVGGAIVLNASNTASDQYIAFGKNASGSSISFTEQMRLTTDGNFGIGVNPPSARLHVRSQTGDVSEVVGLIIEGTGTGARSWQLSPTASDTLLLARPGLRLAAFDSNGKFFAGSLGGTSGASARFTASSSGITVGTNYWNVAAPVNGAIIEGNVGIGLNSTNVRLHVRDSSSGFSPDSVGGLFLENNGSSNNFYVFQVATVGGGRFFNLSNAGNVGIGSTSPVARLHLETGSTTATGVIVRGAASQTADLQQWQNSSATALASVSAGGNLSLRAAATGVAATQIPVFTADPASTTRTLATRTPAQLRGDIGAIDGTGVSGRVSFWSGTSTQSSDAALFWDNTNKRLGVGTASPQHLVDVSGTLRADHITAITKSFLIDHPTKPGKNLRYASLEGPENGVYFRGSNRGRFIYLPEYWSELVDKDTITVNLTPVGSYQQLWVENKNSNVIVVGGCNDHAMYDFVVWAERKDISKLEVEC